MIHSGLSGYVRGVVGELAKDAGAARLSTVDLHYAIERLQKAAETHGWPHEADELRDMALTINSAVLDIVQAFFSLACNTHRLAAIADVTEHGGGNSAR